MASIAVDDDNWLITTPEGRFDTSQPLDQIKNLHRVVDDKILNPVPFDVLKRQYYMPGLFSFKRFIITSNS